MKRKQKRKHLEDAYIPQSANKTKKTLRLQEYALQPRHDRVVPTQDQEAKDSSSEYFPGVSSVDKLAGAEILKKEKETPQPALIPQQEENKLSILQYLYSLFFANKNTQVLDSVEDDEQPGPSGLPQRTLPRAKDSDSDDVTSVSSSGISNFNKCNPQFGHSLENNNTVCEARDRSSESEYFSCYSSLSNFYNISPAGFWNTQEDASQPGPCEVVPLLSPKTGEKSSASEYFSCATSAGKLLAANEDGVSQVQKSVSSLGYPLVSLSQNRQQWESPFPPPLDNNNKPPVRVIEETVTKIYYIAVPRKRSTAVLDTEERLDPPKKEEMSFPEEIHTPVSLSPVVTKELPTESETNFAGKAQEKEEDAGTSAEPTAPGECSSANVPEPPVAVDNDFKCMGCCGIFPSLEVLQKHVEHGIE
ncbi:protein FAM170A-like isoform X2 [Equus caballus]|uniref:protein FAM170A-like isoform X2 n=1 Tax=Equus caballus TaxID=9796 RepID=UPI0038B2954D